MDHDITDDPMKSLDWLESHLDLPVHLKELLKTLKVDLKFLRTFLMRTEGWSRHRYSIIVDLNKICKDLNDIVLNAGSRLQSLCLRPRTDESTATDLESVVAGVLQQIKNVKKYITNFYKIISPDQVPSWPFLKVQNVMKFLDSLLENLSDLLSYQPGLILPTKKLIGTLQAELTFLRDFLHFIATWCPQHGKVKGLLNHITSIAGGISDMSILLLVKKMDGSLHLRNKLWDLLLKIMHIKPEVKEIYVEVLKLSEASRADNCITLFLWVFFVDSLTVNLSEILNNKSSFMLHMMDQINLLIPDLKLLRTFLMDPPPDHNIEGENFADHLKQLEAISKDVESIISPSNFNEINADLAREVLLHLHERMELVKVDIRNIYHNIPKPSKCNFLGTNGFGCVNYLSETIDNVLKFNPDSATLIKNQIEAIQDDLVFLRSFLADSVEHQNENEKLKDLSICVIDLLCQADYAINSIQVRAGPFWCYMIWLSEIIDGIKKLKTEVSEIDFKKINDARVLNVPNKLIRVPSQANTPKIDVMVGLKDEVEKLRERLTWGSLRLDVVSVIGLAGLGKTTLARKVFDDPAVVNHFHVRAWCTVSHVYQMQELLLDILSDVTGLTDQIHSMCEEDLAAELYKGLKGRRYLIVIDDIWNIKPWNVLKRSFPDDNNASRIMFTSQLLDVALQAKFDSIPHLLRLLSEEESFELLHKKIFRQENFPTELLSVGKKIARKSGGLPLIVVVIAGLLAGTDKKLSVWERVAENLSDHILDDPEQCMNAIEVSYKHLPDHLKPCFLYLGAFPEDREIPVWKLKRLWIAEGFIQKNELKRLEDMAEDYLKALVGRSLVIISKQRSRGGAKTLRIHDLLRDLCLQKAKEENFFQLIKINGYDLSNSASQIFPYVVHPNHFYSPSSGQNRLIFSSARKGFLSRRISDPQVRSIMYFCTDGCRDEVPLYVRDLSFISYSFKLLKVLDLSSLHTLCFFPPEIELLIHLRYLSVWAFNSIPSSISSLFNLETFLVKGIAYEVILPDNFRKLIKLTCARINDRACFAQQRDGPENSSQLLCLESFSTPSLSHNDGSENILRRAPCLRKLKCIFKESWDASMNCNRFPVLNFLTKLESLKVLYDGEVRYPCLFSLPLNLRKLTLKEFRLPWKEISQIASLPNLEVLKLLRNAFEGQQWDLKQGDFPKLRYLKLEDLNIQRWNVTGDVFPRLQRLVLQTCVELEEIPINFGDINTLEMIEIKKCSRSASVSAQKILEDHLDMGNEMFNVLIYPPLRDIQASSEGPLEQ